MSADPRLSLRPGVKGASALSSGERQHLPSSNASSAAASSPYVWFSQSSGFVADDPGAESRIPTHLSPDASALKKIVEKSIEKYKHMGTAYAISIPHSILFTKPEVPSEKSKNSDTLDKLEKLPREQGFTEVHYALLFDALKTVFNAISVIDQTKEFNAVKDTLKNILKDTSSLDTSLYKHVFSDLNTYFNGTRQNCEGRLNSLFGEGKLKS